MQASSRQPPLVETPSRQPTLEQPPLVQASSRQPTLVQPPLVQTPSAQPPLCYKRPIFRPPAARTAETINSHVSPFFSALVTSMRVRSSRKIERIKPIEPLHSVRRRNVSGTIKFLSPLRVVLHKPVFIHQVYLQPPSSDSRSSKDT